MIATAILTSQNQNRSQFLKQLAKKHWQVQQAERALKLYGYFLSLSQKNNDGTTAAVPSDWQRIEDRLRGALKLRQFRGFVSDRH